MKKYNVNFKVGGYFRSVAVTVAYKKDAKREARNAILDIIADLGLPAKTRYFHISVTEA